MTPQHPAAPETETDANGLRELLAAATPGPWAWEATGDHDNGWCLGTLYDPTDESRLSGRVERGSAEVEDFICESPFGGVDGYANPALIVAAVNALPALLADLDAARERVRVVEGERDAALEERNALSLAWVESEGRLRGARLRAESAEAAHEAEKAAHERVRAEFDALAKKWRSKDNTGEWGNHDRTFCAMDVEALLGGGEAR